MWARSNSHSALSHDMFTQPWETLRRPWSPTDHGAAWTMAVDRVLHQQAARIAIPKRFAIAMDEIWLMQSRFEQRQKKRVMRLLAHPRFRAAFDFLVIRAHEEPELQAQVDWWTEVQRLDSQVLAEHLMPVTAPRNEDENGPTRKRPRRRKRKRAAAASVPSEKASE